MAEKLTIDQVRHVAKLGRLKCSDEELAALARQLADILGYVGQLEELDTTDVEPLAHCLPIVNVLREDRPAESLSSDEALANAPQRDGQFFAVPKVLGEAGA